jgi:hypothetical protein
MGKVRPDARARLLAEADLLRRRKAELERLLKRQDRNSAILALVERHKTEYGELVSAHRARLAADNSAA